MKTNLKISNIGKYGVAFEGSLQTGSIRNLDFKSLGNILGSYRGGDLLVPLGIILSAGCGKYYHKSGNGVNIQSSLSFRLGFALTGSSFKLEVKKLKNRSSRGFF